jgi:flavin-dependent dehydrogenase
MTKEKIHVVGAGLAGLTAAINLAEQGHEVLVYEKQDSIGGRREIRPDPAGSPFDLKRLAAYTGIDISPAAYPLRDGRYRLWGKSYRYAFPKTITAYMVERGRRSTSLDTYLYRIAKDLGVKFSFRAEFASRSDFEALPPRSIIATGLEENGFRALGLPYETSHAWCAKGTVPFREPTVAVYLGPFTTDYGFSCTVNGVAFAFVFQRSKPLSDEDRAAFQSRVEATEPFRLKGWHEARFGACPSGSWCNPRLFWSDKILAGSVAGSMDPLLNFGMLGAMLSGKIAARAVSHPREALGEFRRLNVSFYPLLAARRLIIRLQDPVRAWTSQRFLETFFRLPEAIQRPLYLFVPGYGRMG